MTPKERAVRCTEILWKTDHASRWVGMQVAEVDEGFACVYLVIEEHHCNGMGNCHGGVSYSLADSAFAFASNSRNQLTVAHHNSITYLAPIKKGDVIKATAKELSLVGRSGLYDVELSNQHNVIVAQFRGGSRTVKGNLFDE